MIKLKRDLFLEGLGLVKLVARGSALPVLACVKLVREWGAGLTLTGTDLESEVRVMLDVTEGGSQDMAAVVSAARLGAFLALCDGDVVELEVSPKGLVVVCGGARAVLSVLPVEEFPCGAEVVPVREEMSACVLQGLLSVGFAASKDESRYVLNGVMLEGDGLLLTAVATDGRRLAVRRVQQTGKWRGQAVVPRAALRVLSAVLRSGLTPGVVDVGFSEKRMCVVGEAVEFSCKLIEGAFPNWRQVMPEEVTAGIAFSPSRLLAAVGRAAAVVERGAEGAVALVLDGDAVRVEGEGVAGEAVDGFALELGGCSSRVCLSVPFLSEGLEWCGSLPGRIWPGSGMEPVVLAPAGGDDRYVLMPRRSGDGTEGTDGEDSK